MSFFSEERASELRELFFESAQELLQALNEAGLELEKRPSDGEMIRTIRRTVHTLKGDSAACGFKELSELAHALEDVLTPEIASRNNSSVAQVVLSAADMFDAMLAAYRGELQLPDGAPLRQLIDGIAHQPTTAVTARFEPRFGWSEYEQLVVQQSAKGGPLFNVAIEIDKQCPFRAAGVQLVRNVLRECGNVLLAVPEEGAAPDKIEALQAVLESDRDGSWIARKCRVPAVVTEVVVQPFGCGGTPDAAEASDAPTTGDSGEPTQSSDAPGFVPEVKGPSAEDAAASPASGTHASDNILRVDAERVDTVLNLVGELIIAKSMLHQMVSEFAQRFPKDPLRVRFQDMLAHQVQVLNELQHAVMQIRMVPVEQLFRRFPRVVRDLSKITGKDVRLEVSGQETDMDKSILDALAEPMTHLVRNAVDHGIEAPEERVAAGKPAQGTVRLNAYHQGNQVVIEVTDDGHGIDRRYVAAKALERSVVSQEELDRLTESELLELIFEPGFSTAAEVTELSGRGVGLDVVKAVLERMKGSVAIHTRPGEGTTFQLKLPLTLAIIKSLLFRVNDRLYAVPLGAVLEITRVRPQEIHRIDDHDVIQLRDQVLTLVRLDGLAAQSGANLPPAPGLQKKRAFVIVVSLAGRRFGLVVDRLVGEEELVIKALDGEMIATDLVSGASILGDGSVVLILNIAAVVERLGRIRGAMIGSGPAEAAMLRALGAKA